MRHEKNGKKLVFIIIGILLAASIAVLGATMFFYNSYDPSKYGRNNGGVDSENIGIPQEAEEQRQKVSTPATDE